MSETIQQEIKARLHATIADVDRAEYRARLARASHSHYPQANERR